MKNVGFSIVAIIIANNSRIMLPLVGAVAVIFATLWLCHRAIRIISIVLDEAFIVLLERCGIVRRTEKE